MNVEAIRETSTEFWADWQNPVINGLYPLRRLLGASDHSAVFLTDCAAHNLAAAAIKLVPAERVTLAQLSHWRTAIAVAHPHLLRLLDAGLCQLGGQQFLFVVMEYADQTLAQVLPNRPLSVEEVRELLSPTLDALAFLHERNLVHSQLKPTNLLVVEDQLKIAGDTLRPAGEERAATGASAYDPPEASTSALSPAGDMWALGCTLIEALSQRAPVWGSAGCASDLLPAAAAPLAPVIKACLEREPACRPAARELAARLQGAGAAAVVPVPEAPLVPAPPVQHVPAAPAAHPVPVAPAVTVTAPTPRRLTPRTAALLALVVVTVTGVSFFYGRHAPETSVTQTSAPALQRVAHEPAAGLVAPAVVSSPAAPLQAPVVRAAPPVSRPAPRPAAARAAEPPAAAPADASLVHEQLPAAPRSARATIHGRVRVAVLVIVDRSGAVIDALLANPGPSAYFARLARGAASQWKFAAASEPDTRKWLIRFEFTRGGTTAHASPATG